MTIPATRVLAFPGIDLETLAKLRASATEAFMRNDLTAYQDACIMMRKLIGGQDVSETGARIYRYREKDQRNGLPSQEGPDLGSAKPTKEPRSDARS
jgi:hypothetical protein